MPIELDSTLAQAEVLFLSFAQIVADIDRRRAEQVPAGGSASFEVRRRRTQGAKNGESSQEAKPTTVTLPTISDDLRALIQ